MEVFHNIVLNFLIILVNEMHLLNLYITDNTSHLELPNTENVSFNKGYTRLFLAILMFRCLKSVTTLLSCVTFLLINIIGLE